MRNEKLLSHTHKIRVEVSNRIAYLPGHYPYKKLLKHWSFTIPSWNWIKDKYAYWNDAEGKWAYRWDGKIKLLKYNRVPAGLFWATYKQIEKKEHVRFKIKSRSVHLRKTSHRHWIVSEKDGGKDFRYQNECVDETIKKAYKGGGLILSATGSGKTRTAAMLASRLKCNILFIVDELVLMEQAREDISHHLKERIGKVGESKFHLERVTVATIQTLSIHKRDRRFLEWFSGVEVIIIDELHVMMAQRNFDVIHIAKPKLVLGLTATLALSRKEVRLKAYSLCGPIIYEFPLKAGVKAGVLSKGIAIELQYDNTVHELDAYDSKELYEKKIMLNAERNHIISRIVKRAYKRGKYIIVLVDRLKHLEEISERLHGIPRRIVAGSYKGIGIPKLDRMNAKYEFERGKIRVIIASKVFKKGISINRLDLIIDAAGRKSREDAVQKFGRGVRKHAEKKGLIYIDISDTDRYDKKREEKNPLAKAARRRKRALKAVGVNIFTYQWNHNSNATELLKKGEKWLKKELMMN